MVIFGGLGNFTGSIIGAAVLELLQPLLEKVVRIDSSKSFLVELVIYGLGLVILMRLRPQGLLPEGMTLLDIFRRPRRRRAGPATSDDAPVLSVPSAPTLDEGAAVLSPVHVNGGSARGCGRRWRGGDSRSWP
jgi:hypothetical protein